MNRVVYGPPNYKVATPHPLYYRNDVVQPTESTQQPKAIMYVTKVEPKLIEHLMMHKGQMICIVTTVGKLEGMLDDVFIDHVTLGSHGKKLHIRICEIIYFEKA
ncbi:DUF2642 domain-containing protein [Paenibacillus sp. GYB004]|uniref:DUF2642 domain-containing protein n=1 Tax=Paenibacillus sp. GYB004 TaxID=2994393 RepID=UPI002F969076